MTTRAITWLATLAFVLSVPIGPAAVAQTEQSPASRQEAAKARFQDLTERMQKLMVILQKDETDSKAEAEVGVLRAGSQYVREAKILEHLERCRSLLEQERWDDALEQIGAVREKLTKLYDILQNRDEDLRKLLERIAQLEGFKKRVDSLAREQAEEKEASARTEALQELLKDIEARRQEAKDLIERQQELRENANEVGLGAESKATAPLAQKEGALREDAENLAENLKELESRKSEIEKSSNSEAKGSAPSRSAATASGAMGKAQQKLGENRSESSLQDMDHALQSLERTVEELDAMEEETRRELLKLPFEEQAKRQEATKHATDTLSKEMEKAEEPGENGEGQPTPGRKSVQQAVPEQRSAAGKLKEYKNAKQEQQDAKENLEKASKELEDALAQLRQELQDEVLRALEERFTAMLAVQRELSVSTRKLDLSRRNVLTADGSLPAALAGKIAAVAVGEGDLEVEASDALKLLEEEGTTAVFPEIVMDLKDQLHDVASRCRAQETGTSVQDAQKGVEETLTLLINALRRTMERKAGGC